MICGGATPLRRECRQISAGVGLTLVVYCGMLLGLRQCLDNTESFRGH